MRTAIVRFVFLDILVVVAIAQTGESNKREYKGPSCLAGVCLEKTPLPSEEGLVATYGPGTTISESRCYAVPEQKAYIHFDTARHLPGKIVTVFVSRSQKCLPSTGKVVKAKAPFPPFETKDGLRLGDPADKVIRLYGPPSTKRAGADGLGSMVPYSHERRGSPFGEAVLVYDDPKGELIQAKFYLHRNKVAAIYLSCSE